MEYRSHRHIDERQRAEPGSRRLPETPLHETLTCINALGHEVSGAETGLRCSRDRNLLRARQPGGCYRPEPLWRGRLRHGVRRVGAGVARERLRVARERLRPGASSRR
jgi:hypothetical protein